MMTITTTPSPLFRPSRLQSCHASTRLSALPHPTARHTALHPTALQDKTTALHDTALHHTPHLMIHVRVVHLVHLQVVLLMHLHLLQLQQVSTPQPATWLRQDTCLMHHAPNHHLPQAQRQETRMSCHVRRPRGAATNQDTEQLSLRLRQRHLPYRARRSKRACEVLWQAIKATPPPHLAPPQLIAASRRPSPPRHICRQLHTPLPCPSTPRPRGCRARQEHR